MGLGLGLGLGLASGLGLGVATDEQRVEHHAQREDVRLEAVEESAAFLPTRGAHLGRDEGRRAGRVALPQRRLLGGRVWIRVWVRFGVRLRLRVRVRVRVRNRRGAPR